MVFFSVDLLSKQNHAMRRCMKKTHRFKVKRYAARLSYLNDYLASFTGSTMTDKIGFTELNDILLNSTPNSWPKQVYVQGFYCKSIYFIKSVNMFELMEISESIYKGVVTPYY